MLKVGCGVVAVCLRGARSRVQRASQSHLPSFSLVEASHQLVATTATTTSSWSPSENQDIAVAARSVDEAKDLLVLLQAATNGKSLTSAFQGLHTLSEWVSSKRIDFKKDVENEAEFEKLIDLIDTGTIRSSPTSLLAALRSLMKIGVDCNAHVVQSIENQLLWNIRKVSLSMLVSIMVFHIKHQDTDLQKKVLKETVDAIQRRWVEVKGPLEIETLYMNHTLFTSEFLAHLDDRTIEVAEDMSYVELSKVFCALGTIKRRATPVIRGLAFHIAKQGEKLTPKLLSSVLFAMNTLSFPDPVLLEKVANDLVPQVVTIDKPKLVGNILFCMGQMRWRQTSLLEVLSEWVEKNVQVCPVVILAALTITLASVSYTPTNGDSLFNVIIPKLTSSSFIKKTGWLDVVWSLALLGRTTNEHIASVMNPSFVSNIRSADQHLRMGIKLKLLNINAVAQLNMPSYGGPYLDIEGFKDVIITKGRNELKLSKHIQIMLHNFLPPPKYLRESIQTDMGVYVDVELATDQKGKPIPVQDYSKNFGDPENSLPQGAVRLAMLIWDYRDYTIGSQELTGINQLALKLLEKKGYKVVQIPFYEYNMKAKTLKNVQYLESKIKEVVES